MTCCIGLYTCSSPDDNLSGESRRSLVNRDTTAKETISLNNLKDSSLLHDQLNIDEDLNCEDHFKTALRREKPSSVSIVHCDFWSAEHPNWLEYAYYFEIEKNDSFFYDLIDHNQMVPIIDPSSIEKEDIDWFIPFQLTRYEGFYTEDDFDDFQVFRDKKTGKLFIRGSQS